MNRRRRWAEEQPRAALAMALAMALPREAAWRNRLCGRARREERRGEQLSFDCAARRSVNGKAGERLAVVDFQFSRLLRCFNQLNDLDFEKLGTMCAPTKLAGQRLKAAESAAVPRRDFSLASPARTRRHQRAHTGVERAFTSSVQSPPPYQEGHRPVLR
jgi:hypothetical protein